ncbi:MAG TPA: YkvA family protein [Anaerolineales bacterium]|nr:YkvA family protein [Anaerolineales bacterium]
MLDKLKSCARALKHETVALYFAFRDPRTPWYAKALGALVIAYAFSPIDLIPDFVPVLGYLDDLIIVPAGIALMLKLISPEVMDDARATATTQEAGRRVGLIGTAIIVTIWILAIIIVTLWVLRFVHKA